MVDIAPFRALRPTSKKGADISGFICPPYDVISPHQREAIEKKNPRNVVLLELPKGDESSKFANAGRILKKWRAQGLVQEDRVASHYLIETTFKIDDPFAPKQALKRYGVMTALRIEAPGKGAVHPHEKTLSKAKEERLNLITALDADISPIFGLFFDKQKKWRSFVNKVIKKSPLVSGKESKELSHRMWKIDAPALNKQLRAFLKTKDLYIADGHHRYEVSWAYREQRVAADSNAVEEAGFRRVMTYVCPMEEPGLLMLPTHRLIRSVHTIQEWREHLSQYFKFEPVASMAALVKVLSAPSRRQIGWVHAEGIELLSIKPGVSVDQLMPERPAALRALDVVLLHDVAMGEGVNPDFLRDKEIIFTRDVDGMKTLAEKEPLWTGFVLGSPGVASLAKVAEAKQVMPPKTTYFYPKVPTGFTLMSLDQEIQ
jgi:uncharacterized protein (DUF1015 family)